MKLSITVLIYLILFFNLTATLKLRFHKLDENEGNFEDHNSKTSKDDKKEDNSLSNKQELPRRLDSNNIEAESLEPTEMINIPRTSVSQMQQNIDTFAYRQPAMITPGRMVALTEDHRNFPFKGTTQVHLASERQSGPNMVAHIVNHHPEREAGTNIVTHIVEHPSDYNTGNDNSQMLQPRITGSERIITVTKNQNVNQPPIIGVYENPLDQQGQMLPSPQALNINKMPENKIDPGMPCAQENLTNNMNSNIMPINPPQIQNNMPIFSQPTPEQPSQPTPQPIRISMNDPNQVSIHIPNSTHEIAQDTNHNPAPTPPQNTQPGPVIRSIQEEVHDVVHDDTPIHDSTHEEFAHESTNHESHEHSQNSNGEKNKIAKTKRNVIHLSNKTNNVIKIESAGLGEDENSNQEININIKTDEKKKGFTVTVSTKAEKKNLK
jgi:hypothetical protein